MSWRKNWLQHPINIALLVSLFLSLIWPKFFIFVFAGLLYSKFYGWKIFDAVVDLCDKRPKLAVVLCSLVGIGLFIVFFIGIPHQLWEAWNTGSITLHRRRRPDLEFHLSKDPVGFWLTFGVGAFGVVVAAALVAGIVWLWWSLRKIPVSSKRKYFDDRPPMEPTQEEGEKYRRNHIVEQGP